MYQIAITASERSFQADAGIEPSSNDSTNSHSSKLDGNSAFKSDMVSPFIVSLVATQPQFITSARRDADAQPLHLAKRRAATHNGWDGSRRDQPAITVRSPVECRSGFRGALCDG